MIPAHIFLLLFCDIYAYDLEIFSLLADIIFLYLDFYNMQLLDKPVVMAQLVTMIMTSLIAFTHAQRGFQPNVEWITIFAYILQFVIFNPLAIILTLRKFKDHVQKQQELKDLKDKKSVKGKIKLKAKK